MKKNISIRMAGAFFLVIGGLAIAAAPAHADEGPGRSGGHSGGNSGSITWQTPAPLGGAGSITWQIPAPSAAIGSITWQ